MTKLLIIIFLIILIDPIVIYGAIQCIKGFLELSIKYKTIKLCYIIALFLLVFIVINCALITPLFL